MGKILTWTVVALAVVCGSIYLALNSGVKSSTVASPPQQLERVREQAKTIEDDAQQRADDVAAKFKNAEQ